MVDPGDYELDRSGETSDTLAPPQRSHILPWAVAIVAAAVAASGVWYVTSRRPPPSTPATNTPASPPATVPPRPEGPLVKAADIDLPPLQQTDPIVRELVGRLSSHPTIAAWLATNGLIENFTVATLNVAEGRTPARFLPSLAPRERFRTVGSGEELFVDPRNYQRYDLVGDAVSALDSVGTASLYLTLKPRITDAYRELGNPEGDFDRVLERAIGVLLGAPALDDKVAIYPKGVTYAYSDPNLQSLSPAQKQLLRLGPRSAQAVRTKIDEIAALLKLQPQRP